jgi:hypothetical protein
LGGRGRQISEFEASLVYKVSSRTARAIQKNPVSRERERERERERKREIWLSGWYPLLAHMQAEHCIHNK